MLQLIDTNGHFGNCNGNPVFFIFPPCALFKFSLLRKFSMPLYVARFFTFFLS